MTHHVIIPAAGVGSRMGASLPKQYLRLNGQPLIVHAIECFSHVDVIGTVNVVLSEDDAYWDVQTQDTQLHAKVKVWRCGGDTRAQTVLNGLNAIAAIAAHNDWVLVHDAARPGLSQPLLQSLLTALYDDKVGGLLALPLADTLKKSDHLARVAETIPRNDLWQAQTPQMFRYDTLKTALMQFEGTPTDEAQAIEALGLQPKLVIGDLRNLKVTYPQDLAVLTALMHAQSVGAKG